MARFSIGDIITFTYTGDRAHEKFPKILVLHDEWQGLVHSIALHYLSDQEINYIRAVLNPTYAEKISKKDVRIRQALGKLGAASAVAGVHITSPRDFYARFVKSFIRNKNCYRLYKPNKMLNVRVVEPRKKLTGKQKSLVSQYFDRIKNRKG